MIAAPPFDAIPRGSLAQDPLPIDRDGQRVLSQDPINVKARAARAAKTVGGSVRRRRKPTVRRAGPKSLAPEIGAFLSLVNGLVIVSPLGTRPVEAIADPNITPDRIGDELDAAEITALASALDAQCRRSPRFRKYVESVLGAGSGGTLVTVIALIAARRAARHGMLPAHIDPMAGMILSADVGALASMVPTPGTDEPDPDTGEIAPDRNASDADE